MSFSLKRIFLISGLVLSLFLITPSPTYASPGILWDAAKTVFGALWSSLPVETNLETWVINTATAGGSFLSELLIGETPTDLAKTSKETFASTGLVTVAGTLADQAYNYPPDIHLATYFRRQFGNNLLNPPAYATFGTEWLDPIYNPWQAVRNLAYALFVVIMVAISLMIILQKQITPRVVVTVTHALPKIFLSLILITLSFPIAALFVDLFIVWVPRVLVNLPGALKIDLPAAVEVLAQYLPASAGSVVMVFGALAIKFVQTFVEIVGSLSMLSALPLLSMMVLFAIAALLVLGFVCLQLSYRYARILILTVFAPVLLLFGALPGQEGATAGWVKDLLVQTLTFPAILVIAFVAAHVLSTAPTAEGAAGWPDPFAGLMVGSAPAIAALTALIILLMSFKIPGVIENAIKGKAKR